ncbi:MAG: manganese efflux pump [Bacteroidales bacterium]|nr:manganese efflux pump [Bacteroidales bacterium]
MDLISLITISIALSMDAFSVSICQGLSTKRFSLKMALSCGLWFGFFQALMPLIGYFLGAQFEHFITHIDHWIAFGLLSVIGVNMIREAAGESTRQRDNETTSEESPSHQVTESPSRDVTHYTDENKHDVIGASKQDTESKSASMLILAIATSIDALAVGVTFAFLKVNIWKSIIIIGITTFIFSFVGVKIGNVFGSRYSKAAEIVGGVILIVLGIKILIEHLFF